MKSLDLVEPIEPQAVFHEVLGESFQLDPNRNPLVQLQLQTIEYLPNLETLQNIWLAFVRHEVEILESQYGLCSFRECIPVYRWGQWMGNEFLGRQVIWYTVRNPRVS